MVNISNHRKLLGFGQSATEDRDHKATVRAILTQISRHISTRIVFVFPDVLS